MMVKLESLASRSKAFVKSFILLRRYSISPRTLFSITKLSRSEIGFLLDPWYHDFEILGLRTPQKKPGRYGLNQEAKQGPLFELIARVISLCLEKQGTSVKGVELFCADGFYANYAIRCGAEEMYGIDINDRQLAKARLITKLLGNSKKITFDHCDVFKLSGVYDFGICAGGLYHLSDPSGLLKSLTTKIGTALVIQTVYSLANTSEHYFETPAPGRTWGCRFSYKYLLQMINDSGWIILDASTNQLKGNSRLEDRGSAYFLCVPN